MNLKLKWKSYVREDGFRVLFMIFRAYYGPKKRKEQVLVEILNNFILAISSIHELL